MNNKEQIKDIMRLALELPDDENGDKLFDIYANTIYQLIQNSKMDDVQIKLKKIYTIV